MNKIIIKELHIHEASRVDEMKMLKRLELSQGQIMASLNELAENLRAITEQIKKSS